MMKEHATGPLSSPDQSTEEQTGAILSATTVCGEETGEDTAFQHKNVSTSNPYTPLPHTLLPETFTKQSGHRNIPMIVVVSSMIMVIVVLLFPLLGAPPQTFTSTIPAVTPVGQLVFSSSGQLNPSSAQGINDIVTVVFHAALKHPASGKVLDAWLLPDQANDNIKPILLGTFAPGRATMLTYTTSDHRNLLADYSRFLMTEEPAGHDPAMSVLDTKTWRYHGEIPNTPTPGDENHYSLLSHLRHLLAQDPTLQAIGLSGGLDIWLDRNSEKVLEYATAARDDWPNQGSSADLTHRQVARILQYIDGINYSWQDTPRRMPWLIDPQAGHIGLLDFSEHQEPPGYLSHVLLHLSGLINAPGSTPEQKQLATQINAQMQHIILLYTAIRNNARTLINMSDQQLRQPDALSLLNAVATRANTAYAGQIDPTTGKTHMGISAIHEQLSTLGTFNIITERSAA